MTFRHRSVTDQVAETLRRMILRQELPPGQKVTQDDLAKRMGVSTMPVREALLRLSAEGLIAAAPNRSFHVVRTTAADVRDVFWVHSVLAAELTRRATEAADAALVAELTERHSDYMTALESYDRDTMETSNWAFHKAVHEQASAPKLAIVLRNTLRFFPDFSADIPGWGELAGKWQKQVLAAIKRGNADRAATVAAERVREAAELYIGHFPFFSEG
jgi:DNA-binding GntR family transcriptional regulator